MDTRWDPRGRDEGNADCRMPSAEWGKTVMITTGSDSGVHSAFGDRHSAFPQHSAFSKLSIFAGDIKIQHTVFAMPCACSARLWRRMGCRCLGSCADSALHADGPDGGDGGEPIAGCPAGCPQSANRPPGDSQRALSVRFVWAIVAICVLGFLAATWLFPVVYHNPWPLAWRSRCCCLSADTRCSNALVAFATFILARRWPWRRYARGLRSGAIYRLPPLLWRRRCCSGPPGLTSSMPARTIRWMCNAGCIRSVEDGNPAGVAFARFTHFLSVIAMLSLGFSTPQLGPLYFIGVALAGALLVIEHSMVRENDLSKVGLAFFTMNGIISIALARWESSVAAGLLTAPNLPRRRRSRCRRCRIL